MFPARESEEAFKGKMAVGLWKVGRLWMAGGTEVVEDIKAELVQGPKCRGKEGQEVWETVSSFIQLKDIIYRTVKEVIPVF